MTLRAVAALFAAIQQLHEESTTAQSPKPSSPGRTQMAPVIDIQKAARFRELMRQAMVLEQDIHAKLDMLKRVNSDLGNLCVELLHGQPVPKLDRLNGDSGFDA